VCSVFRLAAVGECVYPRSIEIPTLNNCYSLGYYSANSHCRWTIEIDRYTYVCVKKNSCPVCAIRAVDTRFEFSFSYNYSFSFSINELVYLPFLRFPETKTKWPNGPIIKFRDFRIVIHTRRDNNLYYKIRR